MISRDARRNRRGQMPLALVAVLLLAGCSFFGIIYSDIGRSADNAEAVGDEMASLDEAVEDAEFGIETALGLLLTDVSSEAEGNLAYRAAAFRPAAERYFEESYPMHNGGVTTELVSEDVHLVLETLRPGDGDEVFTGGDAMASYLRAEGQVTLRFTTQSATAERTLDISADAASGLPLAIGAATSFELAAGGSVSMLTQMMEYQLSSLAQTRVLQGYGLESEGGGRGTKDILTAEDVASAFDNSVRVLQTMFFRTDGDGGGLVGACSVDLASLLVAEGGKLRIDVGELYRMSILSQADELAVKWLDYLGMDTLLDTLDTVTDFVNDVVRNVWGGIVSFFTGKDTGDTAEVGRYISGAMSGIGRSPSEYDTFMNGGSMTVEVPGFTVEFEADMETVVRTVEPFTVEIPYPDVHVTSWSGWEGFFKDYDKGRNQFRESVKGIIVRIADTIAEGGVYEYGIDAFDGTDYASFLRSCIDDALDRAERDGESATVSGINSSTISDPMMLEVYRRICDNRDAIFGTGTFSGDAERIIREAVSARAAEAGVTDPEALSATVSEAVASAAGRCSGAYRDMVDDRVSDMSFMEDAAASNSSIVTTVMVAATDKLFDILDLGTPARAALDIMVNEMVSYGCMNPSGEPTGLPGTGSFSLADEDGTVFTETLTVSHAVEMDATVTDPRHTSGNVHNNRPLELRPASYVSVFEVAVTACIEYTVSGTNPVYEALGLCDSVYSGTVEVDTVLTVPVSSPWELAGVDYANTASLYSDIIDLLLKVLDPIIGPLKQAFAMLQDVVRTVTSSLMEYASYLGEVVERLFSVISVPFEAVRDALDGIMDAVGLASVEILSRSQTVTMDFFGMTLAIGLNLGSLDDSSKQLVKVTLSKTVGDADVSATVDVRSSSSKGTYVLISGGATGSDWSVDVKADPQQKTTDKYVTVAGEVRGVGFYGTIPELEQYRSIGIAASDIPAVSAVLQNLPGIIPGTKTQIDLGVNLKYDLPVKPGLLINEFEQNPEGDDAGNEWVELFNNTRFPVDLEGYRLVPGSGKSKAVTLESQLLAPGEKTVIVFDRQTLNNSSGKAGDGDMLTLYDPEGNKVDETPWCTDSSNSDHTWQRTFDGCVDWSFLKGTPGTSNGGDIPGGELVKLTVYDIIKEAALDVFDEMGKRIDDLGKLEEYIQLLVSRVLERMIEAIAGTVVEAVVFLKVAAADLTGSGHTGITIMLGVDSGIIEDGLRLLLSKIPLLGEYVTNPDGMTAETVIFENVFMRFYLHGGISVPSFLKAAADLETDAGISVRTNLAAFSRLLGEDRGRWNVEAGVLLEGIPTSAVSAAMDADPEKESDLWLFRMLFYEL